MFCHFLLRWCRRLCQPGAMKVVDSDTHRLHAPLAEIEGGEAQTPREHPGRVDAIREALKAAGGYEFLAPRHWGVEHIDAVHHPGLARFLEEAWLQFNERHPGTRDVVPDVCSSIDTSCGTA